MLFGSGDLDVAGILLNSWVHCELVIVSFLEPLTHPGSLLCDHYFDSQNCNSLFNWG